MKDFEIAMKDINIVNLMWTGEDYDEFIDSKIKENKEHAEVEEIYRKYLVDIKKKEGFNYMDEIDRAVIAMEYTARDIAFNEGFKMGVRFMYNFLNAETIGSIKK
jgi:hypothetical protein